jgi:hypothetical protein
MELFYTNLAFSSIFWHFMKKKSGNAVPVKTCRATAPAIAMFVYILSDPLSELKTTRQTEKTRYLFRQPSGKESV